MLGGIRNVRIVSAILAIAIILAGLKSGALQALFRLFARALKSGAKAVVSVFKFIGQSMVKFVKKITGKKVEQFIYFREDTEIDSLLNELEQDKPQVPNNKQKIKEKIKNSFKSALRVITYALTTGFIYHLYKAVASHRDLRESMLESARLIRNLNPHATEKLVNATKYSKVIQSIILALFVLLVFSSSMFVYHFAQLLRGNYVNIENKLFSIIKEKLDTINSKLKKIVSIRITYGEE